MKFLISTIVISLFAANASAAPTWPSGVYACALEYKEAVDIRIDEGEDFPKHGGNLPAPRERKETLLIKFIMTDGTLNATVLNGAEALPNWLFIYPHNEKDQSSWSELNTYFEVSWPRTWYFGSKISFSLLNEPRSDEMYIDITFDDNDGWSQTLKSVLCKAQSF